MASTSWKKKETYTNIYWSSVKNYQFLLMKLDKIHYSKDADYK